MEKNNVYHLEIFMGDGELGAHPQRGQDPSHGAGGIGAAGDGMAWCP